MKLGEEMLVAFTIQAAICHLRNNFLPIFGENRIELLLGEKKNQSSKNMYQMSKEGFR